MRYFLSFFIFLFMTITPGHAIFISEITEVSFDRAVLGSEAPVVVWFYAGATYSGKLLEDIDKYAKKDAPVKLLRMDKTINPLTVSKYKVKRNNTFVFFVDGEELGRTSKITNSGELDEFLRYYLDEYKKQIQEEESKGWYPGKKADEEGKDTVESTNGTGKK